MNSLADIFTDPTLAFMYFISLIAFIPSILIIKNGIKKKKTINIILGIVSLIPAAFLAWFIVFMLVFSQIFGW